MSGRDPDAPIPEDFQCEYAPPGRQSCLPSICDCFVATHPEDPFGLHPEDFTVAEPTTRGGPMSERDDDLAFPDRPFHTVFSGSMSVQAEVNQETLALLMGETTDHPAMSVTVETTEYRSGEPVPPRKVRGLFAWLTGVNRAMRAAYEAEYAAWVAAGRPDIPVTVRTYLPRVAAHVDADRWSFKVMPPETEAKREDTE